MEGFSHALGTNCKKCHDTENFASDDKNEKKIAREMIQMTKDDQRASTSRRCPAWTRTPP